MYRKLNLKFVGDGSGVNQGKVVVSCNILNLYLVDNNLVYFYGPLL